MESQKFSVCLTHNRGTVPKYHGYFLSKTWIKSVILRITQNLEKHMQILENVDLVNHTFVGEEKQILKYVICFFIANTHTHTHIYSK